MRRSVVRTVLAWESSAAQDSGLVGKVLGRPFQQAHNHGQQSTLSEVMHDPTIFTRGLWWLGFGPKSDV